MKKIIIDFDNNIVFFNIPSQQGTEYNDKLDKLKIINSIGDIAAPDYMMLCKSTIIGFDFEKEAISIYQPMSYDISTGELYPTHLLKECEKIRHSKLKDKYYDLISAMGYYEEELGPIYFF